MKKSVLLIASTVALAAAQVASAQTTTYTTPAAFFAAIAPGAYTETFSDFLTNVNTFSFSGGDGFSYSVSAPVGSVMYSNGEFIGNFSANQTLTITFSSNVTAVGGEFFITNSADAFVQAPVTLTLADGTIRSYTPQGADASAFTGFTSLVPIVSLVMTPPGLSNFNTVDNLTVGVGVIPEPGTWVMMGIGLAGLLAARRRNPA